MHYSYKEFPWEKCKGALYKAWKSIIIIVPDYLYLVPSLCPGPEVGLGVFGSWPGIHR